MSAKDICCWTPLWRIIPRDAYELWIRATSSVFARFQSLATNDWNLAVDAFANILLLPQNLLRKPRGGRHSGKPLRALQSSLSHALDLDFKLGVLTAESFKSSKTALSVDEKCALRLQSLVQAGMVGKATATLFQNPLIPVSSEIRSQLETLHPPLKSPLPPRYEKTPTIAISPADVISLFKSLPRHRAPDFAGWTKELIIPLLDEPLIVSALATLLRLIVNGYQNDRFRELVTAGKTFIIKKSSGKGFRPLSVRPLFLKAAEAFVLRQVAPILTKHFLGFPRVLQLGVGAKGGVERAIHIIQAFIDISLRDGGDMVVMELDAADAFNQVSRSSILKQLAHRDFGPLRGIANLLLRDGTVSLLMGHDHITQREGVSQGGATSTAFFALGLHPALVATTHSFDCVRIVTYVDNIFLLGPLVQVTSAVDFLLTELAKCGLHSKDAPRALWCSGPTPPQHAITHCRDHKITLVTGALPILGSIVGIDAAAKSDFVRQKVEKHVTSFRLIRHHYVSSRVALLILSRCLSFRMNYILRTLPPDVTLEAARTFDHHLLSTFTTKLSLDTLLHGDATRQCYVSLRRGGLGLRSAVSCAGAAYVGSVALAVPDISALPQFDLNISSYAHVNSIFNELKDKSANCLVTARPYY